MTGMDVEIVASTQEPPASITSGAAGHRRGDNRRETTTGMDVDIVASTQEPPASITSGTARHRRGDDTL